MNVLNIGQGTVSLDTEKIAEGVHALHEQDESKKTILAFGMLDAKIMETVEKEIKDRVLKEIGESNAELFKLRVEAFLNKVNKDIAVGVYKRAKMVV